MISQLEDILGAGHRVLTYVLMGRPHHRPGTPPVISTAIANDAVRLMRDHLTAMRRDVGKRKLKLGLFLVSNGGVTSVPWRIVSAIREFASEYNVLVPERAMSAATLLCLAADNIYMGPTGQLGPIDPTIANHPLLPRAEKTGKRGPNVTSDTVQCPVSVEDVTGYLAFVKEKWGISGEPELATTLAMLTEQVPALLIGIVNRQHSYIRMVAEKLLRSRKHKMTDKSIERIIQALIQDVTFHGHAISRTEARRDLRLHIASHPKKRTLDKQMWKLFTEYEKDLMDNQPFAPTEAMENWADGKFPFDTGDFPLGAIESRYAAHVFTARFKVERIRQQAPDLKLTLQLPPGIDPQKVDPQQLQQLINQLLGSIGPAVQQAIKQQMPVEGTRARQIKAEWGKVRPRQAQGDPPRSSP